MGIHGGKRAFLKKGQGKFGVFKRGVKVKKGFIPTIIGAGGAFYSTGGQYVSAGEQRCGRTIGEKIRTTRVLGGHPEKKGRGLLGETLGRVFSKIAHITEKKRALVIPPHKRM